MFYVIKFFLKLCASLVFYCSSVNSQLYNQNGTIQPYPYQTALGLPPGQGFGTQNAGVQPIGSFSYPYLGNNLAPGQIPNTTQSSNNYYAMLAQQGIPSYQYPKSGLGYPQPGLGYPQPGLGYPQPGLGYPQQGLGYPQIGLGYQQGLRYPQQGLGYSQPGMGYPPWGANPPQGYGYQYPNQQLIGGVGQAYPKIEYSQGVYPRIGGTPDPNNVNSEIIDVSPEYHRQVMGWPSQNSLDGSKTINSGDNVEGSNNQESQIVQPKYNVRIDSSTSNFTNIPSNLTQPIVNTKKFTTSIRRSFIYDSSKPGETKAINLHLVNGVEVTTSPPPTTTENEEVEASTGVTPKGRRFMDVPSSCPRGTMLAHNGKCISPFFTASLGLGKSEVAENTTQAPAQDENAI